MKVAERLRAHVTSAGAGPARISTEPSLTVDREAAACITGWVSRHYRAIPTAFRPAGELVLAVEGGVSEEASAAGIAALAGLEVLTVHASAGQVRRAQDRVYGPVPAGSSHEGMVPRLGELLLDRSVIDQDALSAALDVHEHSGQRLGEILVDQGAASEEQIARAVADQYGLQFVERINCSGTALSTLPGEVVEHFGVVPVALSGRTLWLAMNDPTDENALAAAREHSGLEVVPLVATASAIARARANYYFGRCPRRQRIARRVMPFENPAKCLRVAALSLVTLALIALYLTVPAPPSACGDGCAAALAGWTQVVFYICAGTTVAVGFYYTVLYAMALLRPHDGPSPFAANAEPVFAIVVPAHNEEVVIAETVKRIRELHYPRFVALVMNDGSTDGTSQAANRAAQADERIIVIDRPAEIAGQGKGEVLNDAYRLLSTMAAEDHPALMGAREHEIVVCILDADGWLRRGALREIAPYYADPQVAGVQIPVRMYNAAKGVLARMQDMEFTGVSFLIQGARDRIGSVGLGGNGQFVRLSALQQLGRSPWTKCLTEDLDIGLTLAEHGWRNRFCPGTWVSQQAVTSTSRLMRQRTRWVQGHLSCWRHVPRIWRAHGLPLITRIDLTLHLVLAPVILVVALQGLIGIGGYFGLYQLDAALLPIGDDRVYRGVVVALGLVPLAILTVTYQRSLETYRHSARMRMPVWSLPAMSLSFVAYSFLWGLPGCVKGATRLALGRESWAKTTRDAITEADLQAERTPA